MPLQLVCTNHIVTVNDALNDYSTAPCAGQLTYVYRLKLKRFAKFLQMQLYDDFVWCTQSVTPNFFYIIYMTLWCSATYGY